MTALNSKADLLQLKEELNTLYAELQALPDGLLYDSADFIRDNLHPDPDSGTLGVNLYQAYTDYCLSEDYSPEPVSRFTHWLNRIHPKAAFSIEGIVYYRLVIQAANS